MPHYGIRFRASPILSECVGNPNEGDRGETQHCAGHSPLRRTVVSTAIGLCDRSVAKPQFDLKFDATVFLPEYTNTNIFIVELVERFFELQI